jgi:trans-2,3-dihydro-3-hydroxyanthranilate isomerase
MTELAYEVVDVFTDTAFAGNPLAVVLGGDDLTTEQCQALANEFHLSETSFPMAADVEGADYRLRIFTPEVELPFAGHPSVGAAWVLRRLGRIGDGRVVQSCGAGLMPLEVAGDEVTLTGGTPSYGPVLDAAPLLAGCGLGPEDLDGEPRTASCGLGFAFLPVRGEALARVQVDVAALRALDLADGPFGGLSTVAWDGATVRSRVFAYGAGVPEDPATGSAALALGAYLVASGRLPDGGAYEVLQGVEMGRPSRLSCTVAVEGGEPVSATVRGSVVPVAAGRIRVP